MCYTYSYIQRWSHTYSDILSMYLCDQICQNWSYIYKYSFKTHISSPSVSYINAPTTHVFNTAEVCFHSGLSPACLTSMSARVTFKWLNLLLASRQSTLNHHTTGWWVWLWIKLLCVTYGGENGTNRSHLAAFSDDNAFSNTSWLPPSPTLPPYSSASGIVYASKIYLKWWLAIQCTVDT